MLVSSAVIAAIAVLVASNVALAVAWRRERAAAQQATQRVSGLVARLGEVDEELERRELAAAAALRHLKAAMAVLAE